jgi:hypothetical protein
MQLVAGYRSSHPKRVDVIQGQPAAWLPHIQHGRAFMLCDEHLAERWPPYGLWIRAQVLPSPKGCEEIRAYLAVLWTPYHGCTFLLEYLPSLKGGCGDKRAMGCKIKPTKLFPAWRCLRRRRGNGRLLNYDQWSCPD